MQIIDISWPISQIMTSYKDNKPVTFLWNKSFPNDNARDSSVTLNSHTGTHVDAPSHFLENGETIETIGLEKLVGPCRVLDLTHVTQKIMPADLEQHNLQSGERILLKTKNSSRSVTEKFDPTFAYVSHEAAQFFADKKVWCVGIDYLGIERNQLDHATHEILFKADVVIIEGLRLGHVPADSYNLYCLPLAVHGLEAAPARAVLIKN
ncbi:cyclase family protein [Candidatus Babeliales bacterium]|nr:cyclase family protein [Candidatus Babeliales bacterium]